MQNLKAVIAYDGTSFCGWQRQPNCPTIQEAIESALERICGHSIGVTGAGRTDSGVHAYGQVAHFHWDHLLPPDRLQLGLNALLPETVRILSLEEAAPDFHARYHAKSKIYLYRIDRGRAYDPFLHRFAMQYYSPLDVDAMAQCAKRIEGEHDFAGFQATGTEVVGTRRTVFEVELRPDVIEPYSGSRFLQIRIRANGFLRKMVRFLVGTMLEIGAGKRPVEDLIRALESQDRSCVGVPAPARGLFLEKVFYDDHAQSPRLPNDGRVIGDR